MNELETKLKKLLASGVKLEVKWDCGGDESHVVTVIDGAEQSYDHEIAEDLEMYLVNLLTLPDVGEFSMEGKGEIKLVDGTLGIFYESFVKGYVDEDGKWLDVNFKEDMFSGNVVLFK